MELNFKVSIDIDCILRWLVLIDENIFEFFWFLLWNLNGSDMEVFINLFNDERVIILKLRVDEDEINKIEIEIRK